MDNHNKRLLIMLALCTVTMMLYMKLFVPAQPQQPATTQPAATQMADADANAEMRPAAAPSAASGPAGGDHDRQLVSADSTGGRYSVFGGTNDQLITLGDDSPTKDNPYKLKVVVDPLGAAIQTVTLAEQRETVPTKADPTPPAYHLLQPVENKANGTVYRSFTAESLRLPDDDIDVKLSDVIWKAVKSTDDKGESVRLSATIRQGDLDAFELTRIYRVNRDDRQIDMEWEVRNLTMTPQRILLTGTGPIGVEPGDSRYDFPRAMVALVKDDGSVVAGSSVMKKEALREENQTHTFKPGEDHIYWYAVSNKYFTCLVFPDPLSDKSAYAQYLDRVSAKPRIAGDEDMGDLTTEQVLAPMKPIAPDASAIMSFDIYCGDKSEKTLDAMPIAVARHYLLTTSPDRRACTFESISIVMRWLLNKLYLLVRNYGVAIIILVVLVRLILHPITRKGQINMMKMQKNQARIKPKLDALQKQYKNDKQRLGEETMKLYREEGINPASTLSGCLPMALQMPIWIALYTTLNTSIALRHEPFFGYIRDLSAPDVLINFGWSLKIPLLWRMMGPISSLNVLPIIMAILMVAQMKVTQKMAKDKKADEAAEKAKTGAAEGESATPDIMAQQQKMIPFIMPLFGLMFYNMPSGLCLYILSNSVLGMVELYFIRRKIREEEKSGAFDPKKRAPKKPGVVGRWFEELQKRAEDARLAQAQATSNKNKGQNGSSKSKKKPRF